MVRLRGFSLIELTIVLAVLSLLLLAGAPLMADWIASVRVRTGAEAVLNGMQLAKMEAIRRNTQVSFWLVSSLDADCGTSSTSSNWVVSVGDLSLVNDKCANSDVNQIVQRRAGVEGSLGVNVASVADAACLVFDGFGRAVMPAAAYCQTQITELAFSSASGAGRVLQVRVTPGGSIRMCDPAVANDDPRRC